MPFTLIHPVAVVPLARRPLVPSALVFGALAPDLPYYVSLQWLGGDYNLTLTHRASSLLWLDPMIALVMLAVFQLVAKRPLVALLPPAVAARAWWSAQGFRMTDARTLAAVVVSAVIGAATHVGWDAFCDLFGLGLSQRLNLLSDLAGALLLAGWLVHWWNSTRPASLPAGAVLSAARRRLLVSVLAGAAAVVSLVQVTLRLRQVRVDIPGAGPTTLADYALREFAISSVLVLLVGLGVYCVVWQFGRLAGAASVPVP
ncbi:DUF4184 family protein [Kineosporia succinea]|uniref:DUF4184 family protein n=1 Tax=Kineosporia succinea TaxID=84632 RepID=A0ABT9PAY2_9ACTN|nr:DUF4184 family protein [Kineosporia succinea]MDP9829856.1 hypothetical protein [Kineosporia succinea]